MINDEELNPGWMQVPNLGYGNSFYPENDYTREGVPDGIDYNEARASEIQYPAIDEPNSGRQSTDQVAASPYLDNALEFFTQKIARNSKVSDLFNAAIYNLNAAVNPGSVFALGSNPRRRKVTIQLATLGQVIFVSNQPLTPPTAANFNSVNASAYVGNGAYAIVAGSTVYPPPFVMENTGEVWLTPALTTTATLVSVLEETYEQS